jgi:MoxR-like ATPase
MSIGESMERRAEEFVGRYRDVREQIGRVIVGHDEIVHGVLTCLFVGGHCLLEGVPGLGKTLLVRSLAEALSLKFSRIQFTPDLMPADILGTNMVMEAPDGKGRSSRRSAWPTRSTAPLPKRSRPCSKRCRKAP